VEMNLIERVKDTFVCGKLIVAKTRNRSIYLVVDIIASTGVKQGDVLSDEDVFVEELNEMNWTIEFNEREEAMFPPSDGYLFEVPFCIIYSSTFDGESTEYDVDYKVNGNIREHDTSR
jgi:hypothetical protein